MDKNQPPKIFDKAADYNIGNSTALAKNFVANVFSWMVVGLITTAAVAWYGASTGLYFEIISSGGMMPWIIMLSPFAFILAMNFGLE